jgi:transaldolase
VSVELHTDLSHDLEGIVSYGERFAEIEPDRFIVKVPLTPTGLIGARRLRDQGIRVNFTLGFSARQNVFAAEIARPNYVNIFLGRLNAFVAHNELGSGENVGERAALASQAAVASESVPRPGEKTLSRPARAQGSPTSFPA